MSIFFSTLVSLMALFIAATALYRNAVLANRVGMCQMVEISLQHRLDKLEGKE